MKNPAIETLESLVTAVDKTVECMGDALEYVTRGDKKAFQSFCHWLQVYNLETLRLDAQIRVMTLRKDIKKSKLIRINETVARIYDDADRHHAFFERLCDDEQFEA